MHVNDIATTIYDILNITPPDFYNGVAQDQMDGISFVNTFDDSEAKSERTTQYFEIMGSRGIYKNGWELYNINKDFSQAHDLAKENPDKLKEMQDAFLIEAVKNKVFPVGGG